MNMATAGTRSEPDGHRDQAGTSSVPEMRAHHVGSDAPFLILLGLVCAFYVLFLVGLLVADVAYMVTSDAADQVALPGWLEWARPLLRPILPMMSAFGEPKIRYSMRLTMISCLFTAVLSVVVAVPIGYLMSRHEFRGRGFLDAILDVPIVLPPLVVGLSLLILFQFAPFSHFSGLIVFRIPAVVLAQFTVAAAFAVRVMRATFDQIDTRLEKVALTLGCTQAQAFGMVVLPQARYGMLTAGTLAWARAMGEFGPLLIFAGTTRFKTEVLASTVYLELSIGNLEAAVAVSLIMVAAAVIVLIVARHQGIREVFAPPR